MYRLSIIKEVIFILITDLLSLIIKILDCVIAGIIEFISKLWAIYTKILSLPMIYIAKNIKILIYIKY